MIGVSLSFCVKDIVSGNPVGVVTGYRDDERRDPIIKEVDISLFIIDKLIIGTRATNELDWEKIFDRYIQVFWASNPNAHITIARLLMSCDKIEQPRLNLDNPRYPFVGYAHWYEREDLIIFRGENE